MGTSTGKHKHHWFFHSEWRYSRSTCLGCVDCRVLLEPTATSIYCTSCAYLFLFILGTTNARLSRVVHIHFIQQSEFNPTQVPNQAVVEIAKEGSRFPRRYEEHTTVAGQHCLHLTNHHHHPSSSNSDSFLVLNPPRPIFTEMASKAAYKRVCQTDSCSCSCILFLCVGKQFS